MKINKRADLMQQVVIHLILIAVVFIVFFMATADKSSNREVMQRVLERQVALAIDSASPGMEFVLSKQNFDGYITSVELKKGRVYVAVSGLLSVEGYPYFTKYSASVYDDGNKIFVRVE